MYGFAHVRISSNNINRINPFKHLFSCFKWPLYSTARLGIGWYNLRSSTYESTRWIPQRPVSYWRYGYLQSFLLAFFACFTPGAQPPTNCWFARHKAPASLLLGFITSSKIPTSLLCHRAYGIMPLWSFIPPVSGDPVSDWSMKISREFQPKKILGIIFWASFFHVWGFPILQWLPFQGTNHGTNIKRQLFVKSQAYVQNTSVRLFFFVVSTDTCIFSEIRDTSRGFIENGIKVLWKDWNRNFPRLSQPLI